MRKFLPYFSLLFICLLTALKSDNLPALFSDRLVRAKLAFTPPEGFSEAPLMKNGQMHYEYAVKSINKNLEIRYAVMPLDSVFIQFESFKKGQKPGDVLLSPNKLYEGSFSAIVANISDRSKEPQMQKFTKDAAEKEFNADWVSMAFSNADGEFGKGYKYCMAVAIHKDNLGDAYCFYLTDNSEDFQNLSQPIFYAMKFK